MIDIALDEMTLKVHVVNDSVWYGNKMELAHDSQLPPDEFLSHPVCMEADRIRVIGAAENTRLIARLYERRLREELSSLEVRGPLGRTDVDSCPEHLMFNMRRCADSPSRGGWHELTRAEYITYSMSDLLNGDQTEDTYDRLMMQLCSHPVWKPLSCVGNLDCMSLVRLLTIILDPRFYVDQDDPDEGSQMENFLGLNPWTQRDVSMGEILTPAHENCALVLACWKSRPPESSEANHPAYFLWRTFRRKGGGWKGDLRASQRFLTFLRNAWAHYLCVGRPGSHELFVPEYFFEGDERDWYQCWVGNSAGKNHNG